MKNSSLSISFYSFAVMIVLLVALSVNPAVGQLNSHSGFLRFDGAPIWPFPHRAAFSSMLFDGAPIWPFPH